LTDEDSPYQRDALKAKGWHQGSLLPATASIRTAVWVSDKEQGWTKARKDASARARQTELSGPYLYERPSKPSDRFALITQECDMLKPPDEFPIVDFALVFETSSDSVIREADTLTSARYFRLGDPAAGPPVSVLDFRFRAQADKGLLVEHDADNTLVASMPEAKRRVLREWLGRRLGREAVSDDDTRLIVEPIRAAWKELSVEQPETASRWGAMTSELRFRHAEDSRLRLYVITHDEVDPADPDLLEMVEWAVETLDWPESRIDVTVTNEWVITIGEHRTTNEIDLAWASYEEDDEAP
jgi:hypothetical protein